MIVEVAISMVAGIVLGSLIRPGWLCARPDSTFTRHYVRRIAMALEHIEAAVTRIEGVVPSVVTLLNQIAADLRACADPAATQALADRIDAKAADLAAAVTANQPATPIA